ncbi:MAG: methyltransferase domain-containing protein [Kibdelosporangium sp.]
MAVPYDAMASVYDRWNAQADYRRWARFLHDRFSEAGGVRRVLDVCCGTGRMIGQLQELGYTAAGVDGSAEMLARARANVAPGTELRHARLPAEVAGEPADAAISCFDSVNYFVSDADVSGLFRFVAGSLRPGGLYAFDVNSPHKLRTFYGNNHYGDDLGEFAYVWRNRIDEPARRIQFLITIFTAERDGYQRHEEIHEQRWFDRDELAAIAADAGFGVVAVTDNYSRQPAVEHTLRQTWLLKLG